LADPEFQISQEDVLRARQRTTGNTENIFQVGKYTYNLIDPGGQRAERRKWVYFKGVVGMIYVAALDEWDAVLPEDPNMTRLDLILLRSEKDILSGWNTD
jgi:guanine nucleotide-binding protein G(i) subunit alpha